jgi:hypothetical protein
VFERHCHKERVNPKVIWIFGPSRSGYTEFAKKNLESLDLMIKGMFVYSRLHSRKKNIYNNITNSDRLENLVKMFSDNSLEIKIPYGYFSFLPEIF